MSFANKIPGCFGSVDAKFAVHPLDARRAAELLQACLEEGIALDDLLIEVENYLRQQGAGADHIAGQLAKVSAKFAPWLN